MLKGMHEGKQVNIVSRICAGMALSGAVFLAGCSNGESSDLAEPSLEVTGSQADRAADDSAAESTVEVTTTQTEREKEGEKDCNTDPSAPEIHKATAEVNEKYPNGNGGWVFKGDTNYDSCGDLTYALVAQAQQGNAQFGTLILMFHQGEYIGIDSTAPQQAMKITPNDDGSLTVLYKDWEALIESGDGNAEAPKYNSTVTYYWDGDKVAHEGRIPNTNL